METCFLKETSDSITEKKDFGQKEENEFLEGIKKRSLETEKRAEQSLLQVLIEFSRNKSMFFLICSCLFCVLCFIINGKF